MDPPLDELERTVETDPDEVDLEALCQYLNDNEYERRSRAEDLRSELIRSADDLEAVVDELRGLLTHSDDGLRRTAVNTLNRVVRVDPRSLVPLVIEDVNASDPRRRGGAIGVVKGQASGAVRPYAPELIERLDDEDPRVAALALGGLDSLATDFPSVVAPVLPDVMRFLRDEWVPDDGGGMRLIYSRRDDEPDTAGGEPGPKRLTNSVPRPFESALSLVETVALTHPGDIEPVIPRLHELVADPPAGGSYLSTILTALTRAARSDPSVVDPVLPTIERHATGEGHTRVVARNLLIELGRDPPGDPDLIPVPEFVSRTREPTENDRERVLDTHIDERAMSGDVDLDALLPALRCTDPEIRDTALWGLECGIGAINPEVHERGVEFLALLNEPHDCARGHLLNLLASVAGSYPGAWAPPAAEIATHEDPIVRAGALTVLWGAAGAAPAIGREYIDIVGEALDDPDPEVRGQAIGVVTALTEAYPGLSARFATRITEMLEDGETRSTSLGYLQSLSKVDPGAVVAADPDTAPAAVTAVTGLVADLAGPDAIHDRGRLGRESSTEVSDGDLYLDQAFSVCFHLVRPSSMVSDDVRDEVSEIAPHAERVADGRYYGWKEAVNLLSALEAYD